MTASRRSGPAHPAPLLTACILASSLSFIDGSVVNVALPAIGRDLHAGAADLQWTVNAYTLPLSALLLIGGAAGDRFGRKRLLIGGTVLFAAASLACALAPSLSFLLAARAAQGVGSAMLMPNSLSILGTSFTGAARGRAVGTWAAAGAIAGAAGPPLGGWLVEAVGWPAIFYINLPVAAAGIALAAYAVEEGSTGKQALDWRGAGLATLALGAATWGLTRWSSQRAIDWAGGGFVAAGVALAAAFVWVERRRGDRAMMPTALFATRAFTGLTLYTFLLYGALGGLILLVPYVLINAGGYSPLHAGLALLPFAVGIGLGSRAAGQLTERIGPRWPLTIGPSIVGAGFAIAALTDPTGSYWTGPFPALAVIALGMAVAVAPLTSAVLSSVDDAYEGTASGFNSAVARTGGLIATALAGGVIASRDAALIDSFRIAAAIGAGLSLLAALSAFATLDGRRR